MLQLITRFVRLGTIRAPFYPLQDGFSHGRNADFIGLSGWKKDFMVYFLVSGNMNFAYK